MEALTAHRLQFAFTVTYHYLFPQLTMGLALLIFVMKTLGRSGEASWNDAARFWIKVLALGFVMGVVTGIPLEFQFGANWSRFSEAAGGVIGQTLALEGLFAFFLESSFLYWLVFQEQRLGTRGHWLVSGLVLLGTWLSGYFIVCTNAFMQHPVGYRLEPVREGEPLRVVLTSLGAFLGNPWALAQYAHTMLGAVVTGSFVVCAIGAFYVLSGQHARVAQRFLQVGVCVGLAASLLSAFPSGDLQAKFVATEQPVTFAAMEGHFRGEDGAGLTLVGQPNMETLTLDNPVTVPKLLSFMTHQRFSAHIQGLEDFERDLWPDNIPLLYYAYHVMVGLGTLFIGLMALAALLLWKRKLHQARPVLWMLMLALPFPFIANTAGWLTAELGRQPWLIYSILRTADGYSKNVSSGNVMFTLLGFMGLYSLLSVLFLLLALRIIARGPTPLDTTETQGHVP